MNMEFVGNVIAVGERHGGTTNDGKVWTAQEYVLETIERFPQKVVFSVMGENIDRFALKEGERLKVSVSFYASQTPGGKWFNNVRCWNAARV